MARHVSFLQKRPERLEAQPVSCSMSTAAPSREQNGRGVKLSRFHLVRRLRMSGAIPLLHLYFIHGVGSETSPSHLVYRDLHLQSDDSWCSLHPVRDRRHRSKFAMLPTHIWDLKYVLRLVFLLYIRSRPHMCYFMKKHCLGSVIWLLEFASIC